MTLVSMTLASDLSVLVFLFLLGACVGSFLNVVIWRLPRQESLVSPGSHCPRCNRPLLWHDNLPILGWLMLKGKCRFCKAPISPRYPIVETVTALIFVLYYVLFYMSPDAWHMGFCAEKTTTLFPETWPYFSLYLYLLAALLAASLIDAELFIIPPEMIWSWKGGIALVGLLVHAIVDIPNGTGSLIAGSLPSAMAAGGGVGLLISLVLLRLGKLPLSFADGGPMLEVDKNEHAKAKKEAAANGGSQPAEPREYSAKEIRAEIRKEMLFLLPPLFCAFVWMLLTFTFDPLHRAWDALLGVRWVSAALGSVLGGLVGGFVVWLTRIAGSLFFGREAMGMGDVDLMAGVGVVLGAGSATIAFFLAPIFGLTFAIYLWLTGKREVPYGPYLSLATAVVMLFYCPIAQYLEPLHELIPIAQRAIWGH
jgi:leader peptidase (prepilin peptidase) / N-methyltransferase